MIRTLMTFGMLVGSTELMAHEAPHLDVVSHAAAHAGTTGLMVLGIGALAVSVAATVKRRRRVRDTAQPRRR